jgi:hypothetical protein
VQDVVQDVVAPQHPRVVAVLRRVTATRYVTPLREGGSLPGLMEADDLGTYVVKFVGAGQGRKTLVAEIICAGLARVAGLDVPELVLVDLDPALAAAEPDEEVQDLLRASGGLNLGVDYLPGALDLDRPAGAVDAGWAARLLWFDAYVGNVDRSWRNPNLLLWHGRPYAIDHGAALTFHHSWPSADSWPARPYDSREHAVTTMDPDPSTVAVELSDRLTADVLAAAVAEVPDEWLADEPGFDAAATVRAAYLRLLGERLASRAWLPAGAAAAGSREVVR